jgi:hypothetical protein
MSKSQLASNNETYIAYFDDVLSYIAYFADVATSYIAYFADVPGYSWRPGDCVKNDIAGFFYNGRSFTVEQCARVCTKNSACVVFQYNTAAYGGSCWLKSTSCAATTRTNVLSHNMLDKKGTLHVHVGLSLS